MSRPDTVKSDSYPDAAGVNPAGIAGKKRGLPWEASGACPVDPDYSVSDGVRWAHGGVSRGRTTGAGASRAGPNF